MGEQVKDTILVVDDESTNLMLAQKLLSVEYKVAAANSAAAAFRYLEKNKPGLILMDVKMPEMDGFETMARLQEEKEYKDIPVIFLTANTDTETEARCFRAGAVDFVCKPFVADILLSRIRRTLELKRYQTELEEMVAAQTRELVEKTAKITAFQNALILGMANIIESRDTDTGTHVKNTQTYVKLLMYRLREEEMFPELADADYCKNLCSAAVLHDVGKIKVSDTILLKPARLNEEEYELMKLHTGYGADIIDEVIGGVESEEYVKMAKDIALYHHEWYDGTGYPKGLKGDEIPLSARIMAVADVFDALYAERCYKSAIRPLDKIFGIMTAERGTHFDARIVDAMVASRPLIEEYLGEEANG